jgi:type IV pilus assembly protein PilN
MIRINLLPQKRRLQSGSEGNQLWLVVTMVIMAVEIIVCFVQYGNKQQELAAQKRKSAEVQVRIDKVKEAVKDHDRVKQKLEQLRSREDAIAKLQNARTGPTAMLLEIARILTPNRGPSVDPERLSLMRRENPLAVYNPTWDTRRLWLQNVDESMRTVKLDGLARDAEDVAELARRVNLSSYFYNVKLLPGKKTADQVAAGAGEQGGGATIDVVGFQLEARVRY